MVRSECNDPFLYELLGNLLVTLLSAAVEAPRRA
jgi:hypothetical protein